MLLSSKARRMSGPTIHRALLSMGGIFLLTQIVPAKGQLCFDGVDDRVMVPYDSSFPTETFTIMAWIKLPTPTRRSAIIARGEDDNSFNLSWQLYVSPGVLLELMLEDARDMFQRALVRLQKIADNAQGRYSAKAISDAAADGEVLHALMQRYNGVLESLDSGRQSENPWGDGPPPVGYILEGPNGKIKTWDGSAWVLSDG